MVESKRTSKQMANIADKIEMDPKNQIDTNLSGTNKSMNEIMLAYVSYITNNSNTDESITEYLIDCLKKMNKKKCIKYVLIAAYITFISICWTLIFFL